MRLLGLGLLLAAAAFGQGIIVTTTSLPAAAVGVPYSAALSATGGSPPYSWSVSGALPNGLTLFPNGTISGTPTQTGTFSFTVIALDARRSSAALALKLTVSSSGGTPQKLTITSQVLNSGTVGQPYSFQLTAAGGTPPYQWTLSQGSLPAGLTLDRTAGTITGTPTAIGSSTLQLQVSDSSNQSATASVTLTVNAGPLTIATVPPLFTGTVGLAYSQTFSASGGTKPYTWSILSGNPGGLTLDPNTGVLQGTPQAAGTFPFTIQVRDATTTANRSYSLTINAPVLSITLVGQPASGTVGVPYNQKIPVAANGGTAPIVWSLVSGSVPGLVFDPGTLNLSGTPSSAGTFSLTLQATDAAGLTATRPVPITIAPPSLSITTSRQLPSVALNDSYSQSVAAAGGAPPYTWSATGLPAGLSIDPASGLISGTAGAAGTFPAVITVRDSALAVAQDLFTIAVTLPAPPAITLLGLPATVPPRQQFPLELTVASAYPAQITGTALLTFSPDAGLPDRTVVFASGTTSVRFTLPAGSTTPQFESPFIIQTGTVAGTLSVSVSLTAGNADITPNPAPKMTGQLLSAAPVITDVQVTRGNGSLALSLTGYSTSREVTQAVFNFSAASGQSLQTSASSITVPVDSVFNSWYQSAANTQYGSQFVFTQPFTVQGDPTLVIPVSVTLTNRQGSTTFRISSN